MKEEKHCKFYSQLQMEKGFLLEVEGLSKDRYNLLHYFLLVDWPNTAIAINIFCIYEIEKHRFSTSVLINISLYFIL